MTRRFTTKQIARMDIVDRIHLAFNMWNYSLVYHPNVYHDCMIDLLNQSKSMYSLITRYYGLGGETVQTAREIAAFSGRSRQAIHQSLHRARWWLGWRLQMSRRERQAKYEGMPGSFDDFNERLRQAVESLRLIPDADVPAIHVPAPRRAPGRLVA